MRQITFLLLLLPALACDGTLEPGDVAGSYLLTTVDTDPPPYLVSATTACDVRLTGGALDLRADGAFALGLATEIDCRREGGGLTLGERRYFGVFRLEGRHLVFTGPERTALPTTFEGDLRGTGVVLQLPRNQAEPVWELELGFEAAR